MPYILFGQTEADTRPDWFKMVNDITTLATQLNWAAVKTAIQAMITQAQTEGVVTLQPNLAIVKDIAAKLTKETVVPAQLTQALSILKSIAKREYESGTSDRIQNEEMIDRHISDLEQGIKNLASAPNYITSLWDKLSGKNDLDPFFTTQKIIQNEILTTPLTNEGRGRLTARLGSVKIVDPTLWKTFGGGSLILFSLYLGKLLLADFILGSVKDKFRTTSSFRSTDYELRRRKKKK